MIRHCVCLCFPVPSTNWVFHWRRWRFEFNRKRGNRWCSAVVMVNENKSQWPSPPFGIHRSKIDANVRRPCQGRIRRTCESNFSRATDFWRNQFCSYEFWRLELPDETNWQQTKTQNSLVFPHNFFFYFYSCSRRIKIPRGIFCGFRLQFAFRIKKKKKRFFSDCACPSLSLSLYFRCISYNPFLFHVIFISDVHTPMHLMPFKSQWNGCRWRMNFIDSKNAKKKPNRIEEIETVCVGIPSSDNKFFLHLDADWNRV